MENSYLFAHATSRVSLSLFPILPLHAPVHDYATLNRGIKKEVSEVQISFRGSERAPGERR